MDEREFYIAEEMYKKDIPKINKGEELGYKIPIKKETIIKNN